MSAKNSKLLTAVAGRNQHGFASVPAGHLAHLTLEDWNKLAKGARFDLNLLCGRLRISRRTLERHFCQKFSESPAEWVHRRRLEEAVPLLQEGFVAKEICAELGFSTETNFSHQFHRLFGCAPREYVRRQAAALDSRHLRNDRQGEPLA